MNKMKISAKLFAALIIIIEYFLFVVKLGGTILLMENVAILILLLYNLKYKKGSQTGWWLGR